MNKNWTWNNIIGWSIVGNQNILTHIMEFEHDFLNSHSDHNEHDKKHCFGRSFKRPDEPYGDDEELTNTNG